MADESSFTHLCVQDASKHLRQWAGRPPHVAVTRPSPSPSSVSSSTNPEGPAELAEPRGSPSPYPIRVWGSGRGGAGGGAPWDLAATPRRGGRCGEGPGFVAASAVGRGAEAGAEEGEGIAEGKMLQPGERPLLVALASGTEARLTARRALGQHIVVFLAANAVRGRHVT